MTFGVVTDVQAYSLHDGPGIRTLVFLKGCPLRCTWCCNPECQELNIEVQFFRSRCTRCGSCLRVCKKGALNPNLKLKDGLKIDKNLCDNCGDCTTVCPTGALQYIGKTVSVDELLENIKGDRYFYLASEGGLTISGGEPLHQFKFTYELLKHSYNEHIDIAVETCGHAPWHYFMEIIPYLNLVLYDIKHMDPIKHKQETGVSNELILSNLIRLSKIGIPIVIRLPLIPHFNLDEINIKQTIEFVSCLENLKEVNLMPFHQLGKDKYERLSKSYLLKDLKALESDVKGADKLSAIKSAFEARGLFVTIGG